MRFALVKLTALKRHNNEYEYLSKIMELRGSQGFAKRFANVEEMIDVMNQILASQPKRHPNLDSLVEKIQREEVYFFDLNLTIRQATLLGWQAEKQM